MLKEPASIVFASFRSSRGNKGVGNLFCNRVLVKLKRAFQLS